MGIGLLTHGSSLLLIVYDFYFYAVRFLKVLVIP